MKKLLCILICLFTLCGCAGNGDSNTKKNDFAVGDIVTYGSYYKNSAEEKEPLEWLVLQAEGGDLYLMSRYIIDVVQFSKEDCTWGNSDLRKWLNNDFADEAFNADEKKGLKSNSVNDLVTVFSLDEKTRAFRCLLDVDTEATPYAEYEIERNLEDIIKYNYSSYELKPEEHTWEGFKRKEYDKYVLNRFWTKEDSTLEAKPMHIRSGAIVYDYNPILAANAERIPYPQAGTYVGVRPAIHVSAKNANLNLLESTYQEEAGYADLKDKKVQNSLAVGDYVNFGSYYKYDNSTKEPLNWRVLAIIDDKALLMSKYVLESKPYNADYQVKSWNESDIRSWLNNEFLKETFSSKEKKMLAEDEYGDLVSLPDLKTRLLYASEEEIQFARATEHALLNGATENERDGHCPYWYNSGNNNHDVLVGQRESIIYEEQVSFSKGIRPVVWAKLDHNINSVSMEEGLPAVKMMDVKKVLRYYDGTRDNSGNSYCTYNHLYTMVFKNRLTQADMIMAYIPYKEMKCSIHLTYSTIIDQPKPNDWSLSISIVNYITKEDEVRNLLTVNRTYFKEGEFPMFTETSLLFDENGEFIEIADMDGITDCNSKMYESEYREAVNHMQQLNTHTLLLTLDDIVDTEALLTVLKSETDIIADTKPEDKKERVEHTTPVISEPETAEDDNVEKRIITAKLVNVRTSPTTKEDNKVSTVSNGEVVTVYETRNDGTYNWYKIGEDRWIADDGSWTREYKD